MKQVNFRRVFVIASLGILILSYALLWLRMITTPIQYTGADFAAFYAAGRIAQEEGPQFVYDYGLQDKYEEGIVGFDIPLEFIRPYNHPPFVIPLAKLVTTDNYVASFVLWDLLLSVFLVIGAFTLMRLVKDNLSRSYKRLLLVAILIFFPVFQAFMIGQDTIIMFLGAGMWMVGILVDDNRLAGLGLAVMAVRPHLALIPALPFLFNRRRVFMWFMIGISFLALGSLLYAGFGGMEGFLRALLITSKGVNYSIGENNMISFVGIALRLCPGIPVFYIHLVGWALYLITIVGVCIYWAKTKQIGEKEIGLAIILSLLFTPHVSIQDLILLIVPAMGIILVFVRLNNQAGQDAVLLLLGISVTMLLSFMSEFLVHTVPYIIMAILLFALWFPERAIFWKKSEDVIRIEN